MQKTKIKLNKFDFSTEEVDSLYPEQNNNLDGPQSRSYLKPTPLQGGWGTQRASSPTSGRSQSTSGASPPQVFGWRDIAYPYNS